MQINVLELAMDWIVPIAGGVITATVVLSAGLSFWWALLLMLPGMLLFQWAVVLLLVGVEKLFQRRPPRGHG